MYVKLCVLITDFLYALNLVAVLLQHVKYIELQMCMFIQRYHNGSWPNGSGSEEQVGQLNAMQYIMYKSKTLKDVGTLIKSQIVRGASSCMYIYLVVA